MTKKRLIRFDWAMKYILRNKANFDVLEGFLSNLLKESITIENLLESESNRTEETSKFNRVDLACIDGQGRRIIIEIQNQREADYIQRLLWGTSQAIAESIQIGAPYQEVVKVISISILYFPISNSKEYIYKGQTEFRGIHTHELLELYHKRLQAICDAPPAAGNVFPEYYLIDVERFEDIINDEIDEWVYFFKHGEIRSDFTSQGILLASQRLDVLAMSQQERKRYESYLGYLASERDMFSTAIAEGEAKGWVKGREEGRAEGREEGRVEGREEGRAEGIQQGAELRTLEIARRMLAKGDSPEDIADLTGLSVTEVCKLRDMSRK